MFSASYPAPHRSRLLFLADNKPVVVEFLVIFKNLQNWIWKKALRENTNGMQSPLLLLLAVFPFSCTSWEFALNLSPANGRRRPIVGRFKPQKWFVSSSETFVSFPSKAEAEAERAAHYNFLRSLSVVQRDFPDHSVVQINPTTTERKCWNDEKNPWPGKVWSICCRSNPFTSKKNSLLRNVNITLAARSCFVEQRWGIRVF